MPNPSPDSPLVTKYEQLIAWFAEDVRIFADAPERVCGDCGSTEFYCDEMDGKDHCAKCGELAPVECRWCGEYSCECE